MLFGNQGEAQADKPVGGRGTAAGWVLTEESGQAVPQSGPPRDGATNPLMSLLPLLLAIPPLLRPGVVDFLVFLKVESEMFPLSVNVFMCSGFL